MHFVLQLEPENEKVEPNKNEYKALHLEDAFPSARRKENLKEIIGTLRHPSARNINRLVNKKRGK